jgi:hypothetical protein
MDLRIYAKEKEMATSICDASFVTGKIGKELAMDVVSWT